MSKKKHKSSHKAESVKIRKHNRNNKSEEGNSFWIGLSIILLVVAGYLGYINYNVTPEKVIKDIDSLMKKTSDTALKAKLGDFKKELLESTKTSVAEKQTAATQASSNKELSEGKSDKVTMDLYVMSQCPYGTQALNTLIPIKKKFGDALKLNINYILYPKSMYAGKESQFCINGLCSMHGTNEIKGDIAELCALSQDYNKGLDFILCLSKNARSIPGNFESCAKEASLDYDKLSSCISGDEGMKLLKKSSDISNAAGATGSPTILINGKMYMGGRDETSYMRGICNKFTTRPEICKDVPEPVKFKMFVVNTKCGSQCDSSRLELVTRQLFPGVEIEQIDLDSEKGKELVKKYNITYVPSYIFEPKVTETEMWKNNERLASAFEKLSDGNYKLLDSQTGATYFASEEKRKEAEEAKKKIFGFEEGVPQMDFFVMSFCPFGIQAETGILPVEESLRGKAKFVPHFVIYGQGSNCFKGSDGTKYCSMHGGNELNEDIRQLCIWNDQQDKFFPYVKQIVEDYNKKVVSTSNIEDKWEAYAKNAGVDIDKVKACFNNKTRVEKMLKRESEMNVLLGVRGSPTVFVEGNQYNGGRDSNSYLKAMCAEFTNDKPEACNTGIDSSATPSAPAGSCG